ncbi:fumarylacetoacetate hydrolase domain-containing protein 2-like isoform X1 [Falco peregrinus]|uniref:fumarylacetoacetate hydrolase domain-containing protein 2-like isoform X1 n=2 Tax=Falco peregrinus TaxID=8954 RepID=UPI002479BA10|nr:fumarylacetoacetate hydrolase domain-containing protein 2-like isoform X1 [Falco peregrinus]
MGGNPPGISLCRTGEIGQDWSGVELGEEIPWDWGDVGLEGSLRSEPCQIAGILQDLDCVGSGDLLPLIWIPRIRRGMRLPGAMRLVRFRGTGGGEPRLGLEEAPGGDLVDLSTAEPALPRSMRAFLERGRGGLAAARRVLESGGHRVPRSSVRLLAPVGDPEKVICVGLNYRDHCLEQGVSVPREPIIFSKFPSAIAGPFDDIVHPQESTEVDWEVELAAVIGTKGRHIEEASALDHVVGYTVANDISARDWQMRRNGRQWLLGKTFDTFCPLGPALVTKEAVADVHNLSIRCSVNGQVMQDSSTSQLIFRLPKLIAWVSQFVTLVPGDILLTGTPRGVGVFRNPPVFLKRGDEVRCEIEELGTICNRVV